MYRIRTCCDACHWNLILFSIMLGPLTLPMRRFLHLLFALAVVSTTWGGVWLEAAPQAPAGQMDCCPCEPASHAPDCCPPAGPAGCPLRLPASAPAMASTSLRTSPARKASRREPSARPAWMAPALVSLPRSGNPTLASAAAPPSSPPRRQAMLSVFRI